jgi:maleamate amidohydrolase
LNAGDNPARDADYAAAGFGGALGFGARPALLIIDFAMAYLTPGSPLYAGVEAELETTIALRAAADAAGVPVTFTRVEYSPGGPEGGLFYRKLGHVLQCFDAGNPLGDFHPRLVPRAGDSVITKYYPSAFFGTDLAPQLHQRGIDTLVIAGLSTSGCVRASALDALCHGFIPVIVADACGDRDPAVQAANLFDLQAKTADVVTSAEVLRYFAEV